MSEQTRPEAAKNLWPSLKRLLGYGRNYRRPMAVAIVMLWLTAIAEVAAPVLVSYFIDNMVAKNQIVLSVTLLLVAGFIALQIAASLLHYFQLIYFNQAAVGVVQTLSLIHISEPTRQAEISYAVFCLKKKKNKEKST